MTQVVERFEQVSPLLSPLGFEVIEAADGQEGLEKVLTTQLDLIFMDGDIMGIHEQLNTIEKLDKRYAPFVKEIRRLSNMFRIEQIRLFVKQYLGGES